MHADTFTHIPDEVWNVIADWLPTVGPLTLVQRRFAALWPVHVVRGPADLQALLSSASSAPTTRVVVHAVQGDEDVPFVHTVQQRFRSRSRPREDDDDDTSASSFRMRSEGPRWRPEAAAQVRELAVVTDRAAFTRNGVYHLTHPFEVSLPAVRCLCLSVRAQVRTRDRTYRPHVDDCFLPHALRRQVFVGRRTGPYTMDLYVWMLANWVRAAGPSLRSVTLDVSQNYLKTPYLRPLVDAVAAHRGVRHVTLRLRQDQCPERAARRGTTDDVGDRVGALRWHEIQPDLERLACGIPHLASLHVDCTGVVGLRAEGRRLAAASRLERCDILPFPPQTGRKRKQRDEAVQLEVSPLGSKLW